MATRSGSLSGGRRRGLSGAGAPVDAFRPAERRARVAVRASLASFGDVDGWLLAVVALLCAYGLVMEYSASEALGYACCGNASYFFERQAVWFVAGVVGLLVATRVDYTRLRQRSGSAMLVSVVMLLLVLVPHLGTERLGARRWFTIGPLSFQPSAVATLVAIVWLARWICDRGPAMRTRRVAVQFGVVLSVLVLLVILERDMGSAVVLTCVGMALFALGGARKRHIAGMAMVFGGIAWVAIHLEAYRASRLSSFRDPFSDPLNTGFQSVQSLYALGSGGLTGRGLGHSVQKYQWLPEAHTDFIFAIVGEELGLIGALAVVGLFCLLAWRGMRTARRAPDLFGTILAGGITAWICLQAFINMAAVTNTVPTTGITLPFFSSGGTSLMMTLIATGVLCNISARGRRQGEPRRAHVDRWRGNGGAPDPRAGRRPGAAPQRP